MKEIIYTENAPKPIGPYSQAVETNGFVFVSGQIAIDPATNNMLNGDVKAEAEQVMKNLQAIITAAGCEMSDVIKCTIFLRDMKDFAEVNAIYGNYFKENPPARETVAVLDLPKNAKVEISAVVVSK
ncbi:MAG: RidA family protein [Fimbriimonadaceae bacterium]|nr:RidA family protein [Chitinophagales bacterium]